MSTMPKYKEEAHVIFGKLIGCNCVPKVSGEFLEFGSEEMKKLPPKMLIELALAGKRTQSELASMVRAYRRGS